VIEILNGNNNKQSLLYCTPESFLVANVIKGIRGNKVGMQRLRRRKVRKYFLFWVVSQIGFTAGDGIGSVSRKRACKLRINLDDFHSIHIQRMSRVYTGHDLLSNENAELCLLS